MEEICKIIKNVEKRFLKKEKIIYSLIDNKQRFIVRTSVKKYIEKYKKQYEEWYKTPTYSVFELESSEYQVMEKSKYWSWNWYYSQTNFKYYKTLDEACECLDEINNIVKLNKQRKVKKRVDCI